MNLISEFREKNILALDFPDISICVFKLGFINTFLVPLL